MDVDIPSRSMLLWGAAAFLGSLLGSAVAVAAVLIGLPAEYFLDPSHRRLWVDRHPAVRLALHVAKNLAGAGLVAAGLLLSLPGVPGQGLLTMFAGLLLIDVPGKHRWERRAVSHPRIRGAIDRLRARFGRPPLRLEG